MNTASKEGGMTLTLPHSSREREPLAFIAELETMIAARRKMTSRLYQIILAGDASPRLLRAFVMHRYPVKALWTRNILGIAARVEDDVLRRELVENIYEEETGALTGTRRHLESFLAFGSSLGLDRQELVDAPLLPETAALVAHNLAACNRHDVPFTVGVASVLLLMEGQPPIVSSSGQSMEAVMRDVYRLPPAGFAFFTQHASATGARATSEIEDQHASTARRLLARYCTDATDRQLAKEALDRAITLRHRHFEAILEHGYDSLDVPFRWSGQGHA